MNTLVTNTNDEIWIPVNSFENLEFGGRYSVSNLGNVRSNE